MGHFRLQSKTAAECVFDRELPERLCILWFVIVPEILDFSSVIFKGMENADYQNLLVFNAINDFVLHCVE